MEVVGTIGAIVGIIDVCARSISALARIRSRYRSINLTVELLAGKVQTVKVALQQIHALINERLTDDQYFELVISLDTSIKCCNLLIGRLDEEISKLDGDDTQGIDFQTKVKIVLESQGAEDCQRMLDGQINALNLLITAYSARNPAKQKKILATKQSQKLLEQVKDNSSSLLVLWDTDSFTTRRSVTTTGSSKLSCMFSFDGEIMKSEAYKRSYRSMLKRLLVKQEIDRKLAADSRHLVGEVVAIGEDAFALIQKFQLRDASTNLCQFYGLLIRQYVASQLLQALSGHEIPEVHDDLMLRHYMEALKRVRSSFRMNIDWPPVTEAYEYCVSERKVQDYIRNSKDNLLMDLDCIIKADFVPPPYDMAQSHVEHMGKNMFGTKLPIWIDEHIHYTSSPDHAITNPMTIFPHLENSICIVVVVDLLLYSTMEWDEGDKYSLPVGLGHRLADFKAMLDSGWFTGSDFALLFTNANLFADYICQYLPLIPSLNHPVSVIFPTEFIVSKFVELGKTAGCNIHARLGELDDAMSMQWIHSILLEKYLDRRGLLPR